MTITLDELTQCEDRLQAEIVERECLLAAIRVLRTHAAKGQSLASLDLGSLGSILRPMSATVVTAANPTPAPPPQLAPVPQPPRYVNPELQDVRRDGVAATVRWAVERMSDDYSLIDIQRLLESEGEILRNAEISVVLNRLKAERRITEVARGYGPKPAVFRKPAVTLPIRRASEDTAEETPAAAA